MFKQEHPVQSICKHDREDVADVTDDVSRKLVGKPERIIIRNWFETAFDWFKCNGSIGLCQPYYHVNIYKKDFRPGIVVNYTLFFYNNIFYKNLKLRNAGSLF